MQSVTFHWVSFRDGLQRVILITADKQLHKHVKHVLEGTKTERAHLDVSLSLNTVGISLVNDELGQEVAYIALPPYVYSSSL